MEYLLVAYETEELFGDNLRIRICRAPHWGYSKKPKQKQKQKQYINQECAVHLSLFPPTLKLQLTLSSCFEFVDFCVVLHQASYNSKMKKEGKSENSVIEYCEIYKLKTLC